MGESRGSKIRSCLSEEEIEKQAEEFFNTEQAKYLDRIQAVAAKHAQHGRAFGIVKDMTYSTWKTDLNGWKVTQREINFMGFRLESYTPYHLDQRFTDLGELVGYLEGSDWEVGKRFVK